MKTLELFLRAPKRVAKWMARPDVMSQYLKACMENLFVQMSFGHKRELRQKGGAKHVEEYGGTYGKVLGLTENEDGSKGPELDVKWNSDGAIFAYHPSSLVVAALARRARGVVVSWDPHDWWGVVQLVDKTTVTFHASSIVGMTSSYKPKAGTNVVVVFNQDGRLQSVEIVAKGFKK